MEDMKKRIANLERVVRGLTIQAAEYIQGDEDMEKPSYSASITIDDCHYECADYEFEIDVEGTTVYVCRDFETESASFNLQLQDIEVMTVSDLILIRKWVAWVCKEKGL
tara:strand:+ start:714 stop:1040 length:327 start_codon:yes stop_codon:yes gene_type:complete